MKWVSCPIWILAALLVAATLDNIPDPPAVGPSAAVSKALQPQDYSCDTAIIRRGDPLSISGTFPVSPAPVDTCEPWRPNDPMVLAGHATDTSPPARTLSLS